MTPEELWELLDSHPDPLNLSGQYKLSVRGLQALLHEATWQDWLSVLMILGVVVVVALFREDWLEELRGDRRDQNT